jgi:hypothetical protein
VLRALDQLLRPGGRTAFLTIHMPSGLSEEQRRRARAVGPRAVDTRSDHVTMLRNAGFDDVVARDVTDELLVTARDWLRETDAHAAELSTLEPPQVFNDRQAERRRMITAIEEGILCRSMIIATTRAR